MKRKLLKWGIRLSILGFILLNIIAALHAWRFTHFTDSSKAHPRIEDLHLGEKLVILLSGVPMPKPVAKESPTIPYEDWRIDSPNGLLSTWWMPQDSAYGTVIVFHGYAAEKSSMLSKAQLIHRMGYQVLLVDFYGSSIHQSVSSTSIGFHEAEDVKAVVDFVKAKQSGPIILFGTSMGAVASMKAAAKLEIAGLILECPFESMLQTTQNRFEVVGVPSFPSAQLLVLWGGIENDFWAFDHNPVEYAAEIKIPSLLIYGQQDARVKQKETDNIFQELAGPKDSLIFPRAGHGNYLGTNAEKWIVGVQDFLSAVHDH